MNFQSAIVLLVVALFQVTKSQEDIMQSEAAKDKFNQGLDKILTSAAEMIGEIKVIVQEGADKATTASEEGSAMVSRTMEKISEIAATDPQADDLKTTLAILEKLKGEISDTVKNAIQGFEAKSKETMEIAKEEGSKILAEAKENGITNMDELGDTMIQFYDELQNEIQEHARAAIEEIRSKSAAIDLTASKVADLFKVYLESILS